MFKLNNCFHATSRNNNRIRNHNNNLPHILKPSTRTRALFERSMNALTDSRTHDGQLMYPMV